VKKILFGMLFALLSCDDSGCNPQPEFVEIAPGKYTVAITNQHYTCTDGTNQSEMADQTGEWTIAEDNNQWKLYLAADADPSIEVDCQPNGSGLLCSKDGSVTIPGICTYPFTVTFDLYPTDEGFVGTSEWLYRFVVCTNGNTGNCTMDADLKGIFQ
jgi:hypothetical protein